MKTKKSYYTEVSHSRRQNCITPAKKTIPLLLAAIMLITALANCAKTETDANVTDTAQTQTPPTEQTTETGTQPPANTSGETPSGGPAPGGPSPIDILTAQPVNETYTFTDSAGREVEIPLNIERIAPSGTAAQIILFTLCPDKLVGFSTNIYDEQYEYIDRKYETLPVFGSFYSETLNLESVMVANPQIIIDVGEAKPGIADDMIGLEERTGIPTIFIHMDMKTITEAYETLGAVTGETEQAQKIINYINQTLTETDERIRRIPEDERVKIYYGDGDGLNAMVSGTVHTDVIDIAGGRNVAEIEETMRGGAAIISMEQLMLWNPDVILFSPESIYSDAATLPEWQGISAIRNNRIYEVPAMPYNWMGRPASVNRILGIKWLSNLLYPDIFMYNMAHEAKEFCKLFYHCDLTDAQIDALLAKAT